MGLSLSGISGASGILPPPPPPPSGGFDSDAQAFITAAGITNSTQQTAINNLVLALKGNGTWNKFAVIYPLVGGNASAHSINLKNPATHQVTWVGSAVHSANGVRVSGNSTPNAGSVTIDYQGIITSTGYFLSVYATSPGSTTTPNNGSDIRLVSGSREIDLIGRNADNNSYFTGGSFSSFLVVSGAGGRSGLIGLYSLNSSSGRSRYRDADIQPQTFSHTNINSNTSGVLSFGNNAPGPIAWAAAGGQFTEAELVATNNAVHAYQTALGRAAY